MCINVSKEIARERGFNKEIKNIDSKLQNWRINNIKFFSIIEQCTNSIQRENSVN